MFLLVLVLIFVTQSSAVSQNFDNDEIDSLRINQKYNFLLNSTNNFGILERSLIVKNIYDLSLETEYYNNPAHSLSLLSSFEMNRVKNDINKSLLVFRKGQKKYHLGAVSDVLGYVNAAAAVGLAAYHLYKYRKKYGIK